MSRHFAATHDPLPPLGRRRFIKAYWVTLVVLCSYLWLRVKTRLRSDAAAEKLLNELHKKNAQRICVAMMELQGLYIKVGQLFSAMTNFLPDDFRAQLSNLQDHVPPRPYHLIEQRLNDEFVGQSLQQLFSQFDELPLASASIGQVHCARLHDGRKVAVKVQYPDIDKMVQSDLITLQRIIRLIQRFVVPRDLDAVYAEVRAMMLQELDFNREADNLQRIANNFEGRTDVCFPKVIRELSTRRVLTFEFIDGIKVNDTAGLAQLGVDRSALARLVIEAYCQQIFHHGIYHADPHPGNLLVTAGPTVHFLDFGAVAEVSEQMRKGLVSLLQGAINRDSPKIIEALRDMGFLAHSADPRVYDRVVEYLHERLQLELHLDSLNLKDIKFDPKEALQRLADLRRMNISLADLSDTFVVPKEWILLERTILLLMGLCTELDPQLNPMEVIRPHIEHFVLGKDGDWSQFVINTGRDVALALIGLPAELKKFTHRAMQGEIEVRIRGQREQVLLYHALGRQVIYTTVGLTAVVLAILLFDRNLMQWSRAALGCAIGAGLLLLRSMWRSRQWIKTIRTNRY